jgi:DNA-directed RNA polymerase subunit RPC12/RpoP
MPARTLEAAKKRRAEALRSILAFASTWHHVYKCVPAGHVFELFESDGEHELESAGHRKNCPVCGRKRRVVKLKTEVKLVLRSENDENGVF